MSDNLKIAAQAALTLGLGLVWANSMAEEPDQLFCAASQVIVCPEQGECTRGLPETANLPRMFKIDLEDGEVVSLSAGGARRTSRILNLVNGDGVHVLQGAESGKGWTATLNESDGRLTITASSSGEAYVVFGVCTTAFSGGDLVSGAARGAIVGGIAGDAGAGAAAGAVGGVLFGGLRRSR